MALPFSIEDILLRLGGTVSPVLMDALNALRSGIRVPIRTRRGGGLGDVTSLDAAALINQSSAPFVTVPKSALSSARGGYSADEDALDTGFDPTLDFDENQLIPCVSSNVDGFYYVESDSALEVNVGTLFIQFQKRKGDKIGGAPIGPPRAYRYDQCPKFVYDALFAAASKGGTVWDLIRPSIDGERI